MTRLHSTRLVLVAATRELAQAEQSDCQKLARLLGAKLPPNWPPPLNDEHSINWMVDFLVANPDSAGWALWYFLTNCENESLVAIGNGGFKGKPSPDGTVELGYSVMEQYQRNGYAAEAVDALLAWAFSHSMVRRVIAHTLPYLTPSIRVLQKCGFRFAGDGPEDGVIMYERLRTSKFDGVRYQDLPGTGRQSQIQAGPVPNRFCR